MARRTKLVATLGPASEAPDVLDALLAAGVDVVRLNLSHSTLDAHLQRVRDVRAAAERVGRTVAVLADLPGPKVRSGVFPDGGAFLVEGATVALVPGEGPCDAATITVDYPTLLDDLHPGDTVILGDGAITLVVESVDGDRAGARVLTGGRAQGRPGVHIPAERLRLTAPTADDLALLGPMVAAGVDFVAVSFVRSAADLAVVRAAIGGPVPRLVAKIETAPAVADIEALCRATDAVMVARGDLGIECPIEDVPHLQKRIIRTCVEAGVPVITATQMLESMIHSPSPTRAEVSDVANAVLDGTDAVMLSAETAIGTDPVNVVETMARVCERDEADAAYRRWGERIGRLRPPVAPDPLTRITWAMSHAAWEAAGDAGARAVICCTRTGRTALAMARFRPEAELIAVSPDPATARSLALTWGARPVVVDTYASTDEMVWSAVEAAVRHGWAASGDVVAVLAGAPEAAGGGVARGGANEGGAGFGGAATDVLRLVRVR
jgi:pyruvate kinase